MNLTNLKLTLKGERTRRSLRAYRAWWSRLWLKLMEAMDGSECYPRWPGERMPPPRQQQGPRWDIQSDDWELAA